MLFNDILVGSCGSRHFHIFHLVTNYVLFIDKILLHLLLVLLLRHLFKHCVVRDVIAVVFLGCIRYYLFLSDLRGHEFAIDLGHGHLIKFGILRFLYRIELMTNPNFRHLVVGQGTFNDAAVDLNLF